MKKIRKMSGANKPAPAPAPVVVKPAPAPVDKVAVRTLYSPALSIPTQGRKEEKPMEKTGIEFISNYPRKNERVLIWDIRESIVNSDKHKLFSLVKTWYVMAKKDIPSDTIVVAIAGLLLRMVTTGKNASVKSEKVATMDILGTGRVKAWLYTIADGRFENIATAENRPEEKPVKARRSNVSRKKVSEMTRDEYLEHMARLYDEKHSA